MKYRIIETVDGVTGDKRFAVEEQASGSPAGAQWSRSQFRFTVEARAREFVDTLTANGGVYERVVYITDSDPKYSARQDRLNGIAAQSGVE
jgi:hypothetical protein